MAKKNNSLKRFIFFAYAAHGKGISGGDRIFIELARRWSKDHKIDIYLWQEGYEMCQRQNLASKNIIFHISSMHPWYQFGFLINYFARIVQSIITAVLLPIKNVDSVICYSSSEFWMDTVPAIILKLRYSHIFWLATWFQTAPNPIKGFSRGNREKTYKLSAFLYFLSQLPIKPFIKRMANFVLVNNEDERKEFPYLEHNHKVGVLIGAVDLELIDSFKKMHKNTKKIYDAVFQGRFHPQKGVVEMIEIWAKVVRKIPNAKLVMIGDGPLMKDVKQKIYEFTLEKNIILTGYLFDGEKKYNYFNDSQIVVHPAFFDSGGMAAAEAMAFGLPCVGFDLDSYKSYYPVGMVKIPVGDLSAFAKGVITILESKEQRAKIGKQAQNAIYQNYSWDKRADEIVNNILYEKK